MRFILIICLNILVVSVAWSEVVITSTDSELLELVNNDVDKRLDMDSDFETKFRSENLEYSFDVTRLQVDDEWHLYAMVNCTRVADLVFEKYEMNVGNTIQLASQRLAERIGYLIRNTTKEYYIHTPEILEGLVARIDIQNKIPNQNILSTNLVFYLSQYSEFTDRLNEIKSIKVFGFSNRYKKRKRQPHTYSYTRFDFQIEDVSGKRVVNGRMIAKGAAVTDKQHAIKRAVYAISRTIFNYLKRSSF